MSLVTCILWLLFATISLAMPTPTSSRSRAESLGLVTCQTAFQAPVHYRATPTSSSSNDSTWVTQNLSGELYVDTNTPSTFGGSLFLFEACNSSYMGYAQGQGARSFGHIIEPSTGLCIQSSSIYSGFTPDLEACSYADDGSQVAQFWAVDAITYVISFLGDTASGAGTQGTKWTPAPPGETEGGMFPVSLTTEDTAAAVYFAKEYGTGP